MSKMENSISIPSIPDDEVTGSELTYTAFLSHEGTEKRTVLHLLLQELHERGIPREEVFYDEYMELGGSVDANQVSSLTNGLLASTLMIVFLTPDFVRKRWPIWELKTFLEMMRKDRRRKLLPVFYRLSAKECGNISDQAMSEELKGKLGIAAESEEVRVVMGKVKEKFGIDAQGLRLPDTEVVTRIMKNVFKIGTSSKRITENVQCQDHDVATCSRPLCEHPTCAKAIQSKLRSLFAIPPLPSYTRLDFENSKRPEKELKEKILLKDSQAVAAVGVKGMGGVGKTTCLIGVANDLQVRKAFPDGVLWIQLSRETRVEHVREILVNILKHAWYYRKERSIEVALNPRTLLDYVVEMTREALQEKRCLIVLDDVWPFDEYKDAIGCFKKILNQSSRILLSTRYSEIVNGFNADQTDVGDLDGKTASALFDDWCGEMARGEEEENIKEEILKLCSNVALAVCIAGSNVKRIGKVYGKEHGLKRVLRKLKQNFGSLQRVDHLRGDQMLNAVIQTTMDSMTDEGDKTGYQRLAVFNSKTRIPNQALEALWNLDTDSVEDRVDLYVGCSLATRKVIIKSGCRSLFHVEFHDQHLAYARYSWCVANRRLGAGGRGRSWEQEREEMLTRLHAELVDGYRELHGEGNARVWWEAEELNDGYFHENYARHLAKSERMKDLVELLMDYRWIAMRCRRQEITGLVEDFETAISTLGSCQARSPLKRRRSAFDSTSFLSDDSSASNERAATNSKVCDALRLAQKALQKSQVILWERRDEAPFQLVGRLRGNSSENALIKRLIDSARRWERRAWLWPVSQCFESPTSGALQVLLAGSPVNGVAFAGEKRHLVAFDTEAGIVQLWNWRTGRRVWSLNSLELILLSMAVTTDGSIMVSGGQDGTVQIWNVENGKCKRVLRGHTDWVWSVAVTEDGRVVVSGSEDETVRIWNVESKDCKRVLLGHEGPVWSVAVTEDGRVVVSGSEDETVRIWNVESKDCKRVLLGHEGPVWSVAVTEDGSVVVSGSWDRTVRIWDVDTGECKRVLGHEGPVNSVAVAGDGRVVVSGSQDGTVLIWDANSGKCRRMLLGHESYVHSVAVTEDGSVVVSGSDDHTVRIWNMESRECKRMLLGHNALVNSVAVTEDGSVVVSGSGDHTVRIWDVDTGVCKRVLRGHFDSVRSVAVAGDGRVVVSGSNDNTVRIWNVDTGVCKRVLLGHNDMTMSVAVTGDGSVVVSGSGDKTVRIWNVDTGVCKRVLLGHEDRVWSVGVAADGSVAVSGSDDKTVRIWDVNTGKCKRVLLGDECEVHSVAVTEDGSFVVSVSEGTTLRIWNVESGECIKIVDFGWYGNQTDVEGPELLRFARSLQLLPWRSEAEFGYFGSWSALQGGCRIRAKSGVLEIVRGEYGERVMSATFDGAVSSAFAVNLNGNRRVVVVVGSNVFTLEIVNPERLEKEICLVEEGDDG